MNYQSLLTTTDNPFDPFEQFTQWQLFDAQKGRDTCCFNNFTVSWTPSSSAAISA